MSSPIADLGTILEKACSSPCWPLKRSQCGRSLNLKDKQVWQALETVKGLFGWFVLLSTEALIMLLNPTFSANNL